MAKKKTKTKSPKPFASKAPKGKVRVHILIAVGDDGQWEVGDPTPNHTLDEAMGDIDLYGATTTEYHHLFIDLPVPKVKPVKTKKVKAKKVASETKEGAAF